MALNGPHSVTHPKDSDTPGKTVYFDSVAEVNAYIKEHPDFPDTEDEPNTGTISLEKLIGEYEGQLSEKDRELLRKLRERNGE
jgi:hypothetical protein